MNIRTTRRTNRDDAPGAGAIARTPRRQRVPTAIVVLAGLAALWLLAAPQARALRAGDPVAAAWARARDAGSYRFAGDLLQVTTPASTAANVGRASRTDQLHIEGHVRLRERLAEMQLWAQDGAVAQPQSGVGVRVERGTTYVRAGGGTWQERPGYSDGFAPQGDVMAYLAAARDVVAHPPEARAGVTFTRLTFRLDGPAFGASMRDQMAQALRQQGAPPGVQVDIPAYYRDMEGSGELWVDRGGLPIRQILTLRFPEHGGESVSAQITMSFSGFGRPAAAAGLLAALPAGLPDMAPGLALLLLALAFAWMTTRFRGARWLHLALVLTVIASLTCEPLLRSLKIRSFLDAQVAQAAAQEAEQATQAQARDLQAALATSRFDPHADPLVAAAPHGGLASPGLAQVGVQAPLADTTTDTDGDGLTDYQEERIGIDPGFADTDEDGVRDGVEAKGVAFGGTTWYLDANNIDSNGDGVGDGQEWDNDGNGAPDDTDADGVPDAFDDDNDGDGVPDAKDLAAFARGGQPASDASPLALRVNNLTAGRPTFVDFQLRPTNAKHLWFAFSVLDWPHGDGLGQVRDVNGGTYADLARSQGRAPEANESLGDMKLIPMLEIRIPASSANLPPQRDLTPYNITVNDFTDDGATKVAYVPLSLVTDEKTGARVAFSGRMRYLPTGSWPAPHQVRLAWVVQALVDTPCPADAASAAQQGCVQHGYVSNQPQVVQTYYDDWTLTGLNVKEDHGTSVAIAYEDPAVDPNLKDDAALTALSAGLDNAFLSARDQDGDGRRDIDLAEVVRRFDRTANAGVAEDQRWAIPNILRVERKDYPTFDSALSSTTMTETVRILNGVFGARVASDRTIRPLLMYAQEVRSRSVGLDSLKASGGYATLAGNSLTVDLRPAGQTPTPLVVANHLQWTPFCGPSSTGTTWDACPADNWWDELERRSPESAVLDGDDPANANLAGGRVLIMKLYNTQLIQGVSRVVQWDSTLAPSTYTKQSDAQYAGIVRSALKFAGNTVAKKITNIVVLARYVNQVTVAEQLNMTYRDFKAGTVGTAVSKMAGILRDFKTGGHLNRLAGTAIVVGAVALIAGITTLAVFFFKGDPIAKIVANSTIKVLSLALSLYSSVIKPIKAIIEFSKAAASIKDVLTLGSEFLGTTRAASAVGTAFAIAVTWGFFIYSMVSNKVSAFSPEFNRALAETIASTIYAILLFVLSATIIGALLVGLIGFVDALLNAICEWGVSELRQVPGLGGACFSLSGMAVKGIAYNLYNYSPMIDLTRPELMTTGAPDIQLADPSKGFRAGNRITVTLPVTTIAVHKDPDPKDGLLIYPYMWLYSQDSLRSSTFKYSVALSKEALPPLSAARREMSASWQDVREDHKFVATPMYRGQANTTPPPITNISLPAGVNQTIPLVLKMAYAVPAYECWGLIVLGACYRRELADSNTSSLEPLRFDVFPDTLDGVMTLAPRPNGGQGLAWSPAFPALADADGDGLLATTRGGIDPDDTKPDADGDGLTDAFELARRSSGAAFNAALCDTDADGLTDGQEAQLGTNPSAADSDLDGLSDSLEVWHQVYNTQACQPTAAWSGGWDVVVNDGTTQLTTHVSSNPLLADADGDGVSDGSERQLAGTLDSQSFPFHPAVYNTPPIAVFTATDDANGIVGLGQTFTYTTTVVTRVPLNSGSLAVTPPQGIGGPGLNRSLGFNPLTFTTAQTVTEQFQLTVAGNATSGAKTITSQVVGQQTGGGQIAASGGLSLIVDGVAPSSAITSLQDGQYVRGSIPGRPTTLIIGGSASDARSGISAVEVSVNGGPWQMVDGAATWTYPLAVEDGSYTIRTRATDSVGNVETPGAGITARADGFPPSINFLAVPSGPTVPERTVGGQWSVAVGGFISDPQSGMFSGNGAITPGSGLVPESARVRVRLKDDPASINTWQPVTIAGGQWSASYVFPVSVADPTGEYWVELQAADVVGNQWQSEEGLFLDAAAPLVALSAQDSARPSIADTIAVGGLITDTNSTVGIDSLEASFAPLDQVVPLSDAVLRLRFDEPAGSVFYGDSAGRGNAAVCGQTPTCPTVGGAGRVDGALAFGGAQFASVADAASLSFGDGSSFSVQGWITTSQADAVILRKGSGAQSYRLGLAGGAAAFDLGATRVSGGPALNDNQWHFVVGTVDRATGQASLYVDGVPRGSASVTGSFASGDALQIGGQVGVAGQPPLFLVGALDEITVVAHALSAAEVRALYAAADRQWAPATLAQRGAGVANTTWSLPIPAGLEGAYQLDLRARDMLGNRSVTPKLWRGVIDTRAPQVTLTARPTGAVYFDTAASTYRAAVTYLCAAQDQYLDDASLACPGANLPPPTRSFENDPIIQGLFPDLTVRSGLATTYTQWEPAGQLTRTASACDTNGNCTTVSTPVDTAPAATGAPRAVVASPADQSVVAASGAVSALVVAEADQPLREVTLSLDGQVVDTATFAQGDAVSRNQRTVSVAVSGEGAHTLVARATDWTGRVQTTLFPVAFTLDTQPPAVTIDDSPLTAGETYGPGSDVLRFSGTASDGVGIAAVQISVNGGPFVDVTFGGGTWRTALPVADPEGKVLSVTVRAVDLAGRVSEATRPITVDISTPNPPDTAIASGPPDPDTTGAASFSFTGTPGERAIGGYECQLDGGPYAPCASPTSYGPLSTGQHTFQVRAIDSQGYVDPSPASYRWTVADQPPAATGTTIYLPVIRR